MAGVATGTPRAVGATDSASGLTPRQLAGVASCAVAVATWSAMAAGWLSAGKRLLPLLLLGLVLVAGAAGAMAPRRRWTLPAGKDLLVLTVVTVLGLLALYLAGWTGREDLVRIAGYLPVVVAALSILWPDPKVLRYCLLLAAGTLLGAPQPSRPALIVALVAMAVALVATNRLATAAAPRLGDAPAVRFRRMATEAGAVLVIVGLLAALAASLVPPPAGSGGGFGDALRGPGRLPQPAAPAIHFEDRLDVAAGRGKPGDEYVLLVRAPEPDVWRALTYDHWDGGTWSRSVDNRDPVEDAVEPGIGDVRSAIDFDTPLGSRSARFFQSMTVLARSADTLVAAPVPSYATALTIGVEQGVDASLHPTEPLRRGDRYLVASDRPAASAADLRALGDTPARAVPFDVARTYLQLPEVTPAVRALAAQLAVRELTTFDKAAAVEAWIDGNTTVTDEAPPVPPGTDALETFLLENRSGPPERAATAMVVMLRAVGVPARLAIGYLPGRRDGPDDPFVVRASDVHAWVEVWFPTAGWQRFDPTGRAPDPRAGRESFWDRLLRFLEKLWPLVALLVVAGAAWLAWRIERWRRRRAALPWSTRFFARVERAGRARGRPRRPPETPAEYARALSRSALPDPRMAEVGELVTVAAWSPRQPPAEDRARAEEVLRAAKKAAPVRRLRRPYRSRVRRLLRLRRPRPTIAKP